MEWMDPKPGAFSIKWCALSFFRETGTRKVALSFCKGIDLGIHFVPFCRLILVQKNDVVDMMLCKHCSKRHAKKTS